MINIINLFNYNIIIRSDQYISLPNLDLIKYKSDP